MKSPGSSERTFVLSIDEFPIAAFLAKNYSEARELVHEQWLHEDLASKTFRGRPLWIADATLSVRSADEFESKTYHEGKAAAETGDGLTLVFLIPIDTPGKEA